MFQPIRLGTLSKSLLALVATGVLVVSSGVVASAGSITTTSGITGGALTLATVSTANLNATLTGQDLSVTGNLGAATIADATGSGAGWNLTITGTTFKTTSNKTLPVDALTVTGITVVKNAGKSPTNTISYPLTVPTGATAPSAVKLFSAAADTGMGHFTITPNVSLSIPADTYAGSYASTITLSVVSGP